MGGSTAIKISNDLVEKARSIATIYNRSITKQIEYWAKLGRMALENPDLPIGFVMDIIEAKEQVIRGDFSIFEFEKNDFKKNK
ncbi:MAG: ParD-like family protein [Rickettsiales bacterium]|jgi:hypothetical protein|nr:ParD-like family protein [Rickettsiales bacterium]